MNKKRALQLAREWAQGRGAAQTDEAVEMVMERWKEAVNNEA